jgi:hypothetical protein
MYAGLADLTAVVHGAFILFVMVGGILLLRWPRLAWLHAPVALYGITIMLFNWQCPLTDVETGLRRRAGEIVEWEAYINHYILNPMGLDGGEWFITPVAIGLILLGNGWGYWRLVRRREN